jgi:Restriction endonuclease BglII
LSRVTCATGSEEVLLASTIPIEELIGSGGGEAKGTQRLRNALKQRGWRKHKFVVQRIIDGIEREAQSHEVDHVRTFEGGTVALEIEWNNKDPFFDRDLENFKRLHADGAISLGVIITRGSGLQEAMRTLVRRFADGQHIDSHTDMALIGLRPTRRQVEEVRKRVEGARNPIPFRDTWVAAMRRCSPKRCVDQRPLLVGSTERLRQQLRLCVRGLVARLVTGRHHHRGPI